MLHGACASPNVPVFQQEVDNNILATWPHLTTSKVSQHIRSPNAAIIGHMDHQRKNNMSANKTYQSTDDLKADVKPEPASTRSKKKVYVTTYETKDRISQIKQVNFLPDQSEDTNISLSYANAIPTPSYVHH